MCDFGLVIGALSLVVGAVGAVQQANAAAADKEAAAEAADYTADVQTVNANINEFDAHDAINRGKVEEQKQRQSTAAIQGQQRVAQAASGVDVNFGSAKDLAIDTAMLGELDALTIKTNSYDQAYDHKVDAMNNRSGAAMSVNSAANYRTSAQSTRAGGFLTAAGIVLGGAGNLYSSYRKKTSFI